MTRIVGVRVSLVAAAVLAVSPAFGQKGGPTGTGSTGAGSTGTTGTGTTGTGTTGTGTPGLGRTPSTTTPTPTQQSPTQTIQQPIFLSGRVMVDDGAPPSESAVIQTVCNGVPRSEGYTDSKGYFSVELGSNRGVIQDASEYSNSNTTMGGALSGRTSSGGVDSERKYLGCDLQAKLAGFRSQTVPLSGRRPMDDPNINDWRAGSIEVESPPEYMESSLAHLDERHGGAAGLLRANGLTDAELDALVELITEPITA